MYPLNMLGYNLLLGGNVAYLQCVSNVATETGYSLDPSENHKGYKRDFGMVYAGNDRWHGYRMDVTPLSGSADRITIYTAEIGRASCRERV